MQIVETVRELRALADAERASGRRVALVPTMGALHAGHRSLIELARSRADRVWLSLFVNPTQFDDPGDLARYPRSLERDVDFCREAGVDLVFVPPASEMYPEGASTWVEVAGLSEPLCGASRPGHFRGVATVVAKLLMAARPQLAVFGEKDYQQLLVIRRMVADLKMRIRIEGVPTVRDPDGVAMSSRNGYLTAEERARAPALQRALVAARDALVSGSEAAEVEAGGLDALAAAGMRPDYFQVRRQADLEPPGVGDPVIVLAAAWLGRARLIDNLKV